MAAFTIKQTVLRNILANAITQNTRIIDIAHELANDKLEIEKAKMINDFEDHKYSMEIKAGPKAENSSNSLGGYGNLFSFIGFVEGSNPIGNVTNILREYTFLKKSSRGARYLKNSVRYEFEVYFPAKEELRAETPFPWGTGDSWLFGIETYISGVNYYLYSRSKKFKTSRSGPAIQVETDLRLGKFERPPFFIPAGDYISKILENFKKKFKK